MTLTWHSNDWVYVIAFVVFIVGVVVVVICSLKNGAGG